MYKSFTDMEVWQDANNLSVDIFHLTQNLPRFEDYGLTSQIRRSANSVSANIAEGFGRKTAKDKTNFYIMSRGSAFETQNHLIYGMRVAYFDKEKVDELVKQYNLLIFNLNKIIKSIYQPQPQPHS